MNLVRTAMLIALMTALFMGVGYLIGGGTGMTIAFVIAAGMNLFSYWNSDKMVLRMHHAVEVGPQNAPEYYEIVRRLAEAAEMPMPKTFLIKSPQPNAFATGRNPENAAVAATTGLLERLSAEEVAGVMAHELAHIANRDTLTMTITATLAGAISMLGNFALFFGGNRNGNNAMGLIGTLVAILVAPFAAMLVQMAISRTREYSADRLGAQICGRPLWLASALEKISAATKQIPNDSAEANPASAHMFIINPLGQHGRDSLFSTHPNVMNRIAALQEMHGSASGGPDLENVPSGEDSPGPWSEPVSRRAPERDASKPAQWGRNAGKRERGGRGSGGPWN